MDKPIRIFAEAVDGTALDQFYSAMKLDCAVQGALMPDAHAGYTLPIGAVVATVDTVFPSFVGYDLGCGMSALPVPAPAEIVRKHAQEIFTAITDAVPLGFNVNERSQEPCTRSHLDTADLTAEARAIAESDSKRNWLRARGSLGGGNHFIEVGADEAEQLWVVIHSGSRGLGHGIATHYMKLASPDGRAREGLYGLSADSPAGQAYVNDLDWSLRFALENRLEMMHRVARVLKTLAGFDTPVDWGQLINRNHNHAELKDGRWIHRKGATHAEAGMLGVIPGNMRDGSFIVRGKGHSDALCSSSHGAGRALGRKQAATSLKLDDFEQTMREAGVLARVDAGTLDESPFAYKDIFSVMAQQKDLVEVLHHVRPILNVKG